MSTTPFVDPAEFDPQRLVRRSLPGPLGSNPPATLPVTMPDPHAPQYQPLHGLSALGPVLSQFAGIPTKSGLQPLEGVRQLGQRALEMPQQRYAQDLAAAKGNIEAQRANVEANTAQSEGKLRTAQTEKEQTETEALRKTMGLPKPVADDKVTATGPNNEKIVIQGSDVGGKRVYSVTGAGAPTADSPTTAEGALQEYLQKKTTPVAVPIQPSGGLTPPRLSAGTPTAIPVPGTPTPAPQNPLQGWTMGEAAPDQRPASDQEIQGIRDAIDASGIAPDEKAALVKELRAGMTTKELDTLSGRYENAAGRVTQQSIANKNREAAHQEAENEKEALRDQDTVFAFDPKTKQRIYTTRGEAKAAGYTNVGKAVTEAEVSKEEATTRQFNDVQMNVSRYKTAIDALTTDIPKDQVDHMTSIIAKLPQIEKAGGDGFIGELSMGILPTITNVQMQKEMAKSWNALGPEEQELMTGYFRARGSLLAYQKALTGTGRSSQLGLQLEMPNLPEPYVGATVADKRLKAFQENIDTASKGLVRFPWLDSPEQIRKGIERPSLEEIFASTK